MDNSTFLVVSGGEQRVQGHPGWFWGDEGEARLLTPDELVAAGYGLKVIDNPPTYDPATQTLAPNPVGQWTLTATTAEKTHTVTDIPLASLHAAKLAALAERRWQAETGGIVIGAVPIKTDRESVSKLTAAYIKAKEAPDFVISNWKVTEGVFVTLDAATLIAIGDAVTAHVQACFDREAALSAQILAAADTAALAAIDVNEDWPG